jgi:hypothetical protein
MELQADLDLHWSHMGYKPYHLISMLNIDVDHRGWRMMRREREYVA